MDIDRRFRATELIEQDGPAGRVDDVVFDTRLEQALGTVVRDVGGSVFFEAWWAPGLLRSELPAGPRLSELLGRSVSGRRGWLTSRPVWGLLRDVVLDDSGAVVWLELTKPTRARIEPPRVRVEPRQATVESRWASKRAA
jgi:hypothetical protein